MIWNLLIIAALAIILIIMARRLPDARKNRLEVKHVSNAEISLYGIISQADEEFNKKKFNKAEALYIQAASQDPNNPKIYSKLGAIYLEQNNYYDAKDAFIQAVKLEPGLASRYVNLGLAYMGLKDYYKANHSFKDALKYDAKNKKYHKLLERSEKLLEKEKKKK